jgi:hypothetical protein
MRQGAIVITRSLASAIAACVLLLQPAFGADATPPAGAERPQAGIGEEQPTDQVQQLRAWVLATGDNRAMPFVIIDKVAAKVFVYRRDGQLRAASPALLGLAQGDDTVPGIGNRPLATIRPDERTTPAGRFVASLAGTGHGDEVLWVDYDASVALHRVVDVPRERRFQRLASGSALDRRITYGCINVPAKFFDTVVRPTFKGTSGIVYVLPETRSPQQVFGSSGN